jgi:hypothetical protein
MSTSLDERLHRYFDALDPEAVHGDPDRAIVRARSRRRHQLGGMAGCLIVVLAGLGIVGATLLDDDSPGPVVIEGEEGTGQRWIVGSSDRELGLLREAWAVGDDAIIGPSFVEPQDTEEGLRGLQVLRDDGDGKVIVDTGIDFLHDLAGAGDDLYAVGEMGAGMSNSPPGELAIAHSSDAGRTWDVVTTDVELPDDRSQVQIATSDDFLVIQARRGVDIGGQTAHVLHTFDLDELGTSVASRDASTGPWSPRASGGGVIVGAEAGEPLWSLDGTNWTEADPPTEDALMVAILSGEPVWIDVNFRVIDVGGIQTDLAQLLGAPEPFVSHLLVTSDGDELQVVVRADDSPDGYRLLRTEDGIDWSTTPLLGPPDGFDDVSYVDSHMTVDGEGRVMIDAILRPSGTDVLGPRSVLVVEPDAPSTPITGPVEGTVRDVELSHQLIEGPEVPFFSGTTGGFVDDGFVVWGSVQRAGSGPDDPLESQFMRWDGSAWATVTTPLVEGDPDDGGWGRTLVADDQGLALIGLVDGGDGTQLIESTDGGRTWTTAALPLEIHPYTFPAWSRTASHLLLGTFGGPNWFRNDGAYEESSRLVTPGGAYEVNPVGDDLWLRGSKDIDGDQVSWTMKLAGDGTVEEWTLGDDTGQMNHVFPLRDDTVTVVEENPPLLTTTVSGPSGEVVLNEVDGLEDFLLYDVRATGDELILVGADGRSSMLTGVGNLSNVLTLLWSSDGVSWSRYDIALDEGLEVGGSLIAVTDDQVLVELSAKDANSGEPSTSSGFAIVER